MAILTAISFLAIRISQTSLGIFDIPVIDEICVGRVDSRVATPGNNQRSTVVRSLAMTYRFHHIGDTVL